MANSLSVERAYHSPAQPEPKWSAPVLGRSNVGMEKGVANF